MNPKWIKDFERMMWNEGEKLIFDGEIITEILTQCGYYQGERIWKYYMYNRRHIIIEEGRISLEDYK